MRGKGERDRGGRGLHEEEEREVRGRSEVIGGEEGEGAEARRG